MVSTFDSDELHQALPCACDGRWAEHSERSLDGPAEQFFDEGLSMPAMRPLAVVLA